MPGDVLQIAIYKLASPELTPVSAKIEGAGFALQELENEQTNGFALKLYYRQRPQPPRWKRFVGTIARPGQDILRPSKSWSEDFILLLIHAERNVIYAVTGGTGFFLVQEFADDDFGMDIFSRLLKKEDKVLKATREKGVVGSVLGLTQHFRRNSNLYEIDSFGKIYQELKANLRKDVLVEKMGLLADDVKKDSICIAKSSFRINKAISFEDLLRVIEGCESVLETEVPVSINDVEKITKKRDALLVDQLDAALFDQLWTRYSDTENSVSFDLCDRDFEKYLTASTYIVRKGASSKNLFGDYEFDELTDIDSLLDQIRLLDNSPETKDAFIKLTKGIKIFSFDENDEPLTQGDLLAHIMGDVTVDGKKYFFIDKTWFRIKDTFVADLNARCKAYIDKNFFDKPLEPWDYNRETENNYNRKYIGKENFIVLDRVTPDNIEPCDVLHWDDDTLYFIHIKSGFGNTMRDLCAQLLIAARKIGQDLASSKDFVEKIYDSMQAKIGGEPYFDAVGRQTEVYSKDDFVALFSKKIVFVLAVCDTKTAGERDIHNVDAFNSNIAKFSLEELSRAMRGQDFDFRVAQIFRP